MLSERRARERQRQARRQKPATIGAAIEPAEMNSFVFDWSELDGDDELEGPGIFRFDLSRLDGPDVLSGRRAAPEFQFDHSELDGKAVLI